jgi:signal transduction histidine kinase
MIGNRMVSQICCPHCGQPVVENARTCGNCGVDLAIAAVLAEREIFPVRFTGALPVTPEILVPRLGEYLVEKGKLAPADLERALEFQRQRGDAGRPLLLGQALCELKLIEPKELDKAITEQILNLQNALKRSNMELEARVHERTVALERAVEKLSELSQLKANFVANVSHELRTPLTHIKGYIDLLAEGTLGPLSEEQADAVRVMLAAEDRLESLIEDLIQFSLVARDQFTVSFSSVDISALIRENVSRAQGKVKMAGLSFEMKLTGGLPSVRCDAEKITWVIGQLLDNACKFTPRGGKIKLEAYQSNNFVKISVTDTGIGIPDQRLDEIYEPFHQLDGSITRRYNGTGLGLALSKRILAAHGTHIVVLSKEGQGSRFEFSLPLAESILQEV